MTDTEREIEKLIDKVEQKIIKNAHYLAVETVLTTTKYDEDNIPRYSHYLLLDSLKYGD